MCEIIYMKNYMMGRADVTILTTFTNANQNGEQFGQDNFQQLFLQQQSLDMNTLIDTVFRTVYEYCKPEPLDDDETLLVIRRKSSTTDLVD